MSSTPDRPKSKAAILVSILSAKPETLDGLQAYFDGVGVEACCTHVANIDTVAPPCVTVAVIFPDEFKDAEVLDLVRDLRRARPRLLALLVTCEPQRFRDVAGPDGISLPPLLFPKPSFGWDILDAIRAHAPALPSTSED